MNTRRWMTGLLAVAFLTCEAALFQWTITTSSAWPHPASVALLGIALAGLTLASGWVIFGQANVAVRCICLLVIQLSVAYLGSQVADGRYDSWSLAVGIYAACLLAGMLLSRCCGVNLHWKTSLHTSRSLARRQRQPQVSIWYLLSLITAAAALLAFWTDRSLNWEIGPRSLLFFGFLSCIASASLWSGIRGRLGVNVILMAGGLLATSAWFHWMQYRGLEQVTMISLALVLQTTLLASALILRCAGLRFDSRPASSRPVSTTTTLDDDAEPLSNLSS